jgi:tetratricopeptide (TPR) repeat protein
MSIPYSAGSIYSTVEDLYLWDRALYSDKVLSVRSKELMFKPYLRNYGYGIGIIEVSVGEPKRKVLQHGHTGGINGFASLMVRLVGDQHLIVLLDNSGEQGKSHSKIQSAIRNILYDQPYNFPNKSIAEAIYNTVIDKGVDAAVKQYRDLKANQSATYDFSEPELNTLGYELMRMKKIKEAIEIFKLNVESFPRGFNTYDSLGEAYMVNSDKELAIKNYKKSLELNPENTNAANAIKRLENQLP